MVSDAIYILSRPLAFAAIKHRGLNYMLFWPPIFIALILTIVVWYFSISVRLVGDGSLSRQLISIFSTLPGFFIAAVAAIATFQRVELDEIMPSPTPTIEMKTAGKYGPVELTFRLFLSYLFSYLTIVSFAAVLLVLGADLVGESLKSLLLSALPLSYQKISSAALSHFYLFVILWLVCKIFMTTLVGLYFLTERIHRPTS